MDFNKKIKISNKDRYQIKKGDDENNESQGSNEGVQGAQEGKGDEKRMSRNSFSNRYNSGGIGRNYNRPRGGDYNERRGYDGDKPYQQKENTLSYIPLSKKLALQKIVEGLMEMHDINYEGEELVKELTSKSDDREPFCVLTFKALDLLSGISDCLQYQTRNFSSVFSKRSDKYFCIVPGKSHRQQSGSGFTQDSDNKGFNN